MPSKRTLVLLVSVAVVAALLVASRTGGQSPAGGETTDEREADRSGGNVADTPVPNHE